MFTHADSLSHYSKKNVIVWLMLAFQAGSINTGGLMSAHQLVSHVTGYASHFGLEFAEGNYHKSLNLLVVPLFFLVGSSLSAFFVDRKIQRKQYPLYFVVMLLMSVLLGFVTFHGVNQGFGTFGDPPDILSDFSLVSALCLASGIQNSTVTSAFGSIIRTTHLTGITTDLGIGLVRVMSKTHVIQTRSNEIKANWMRIGIIFFFVFGSLVAALAFLKYQYWGFILPTTISSVLFVSSALRYIQFKKNEAKK